MDSSNDGMLKIALKGYQKMNLGDSIKMRNSKYLHRVLNGFTGFLIGNKPSVYFNKKLEKLDKVNELIEYMQNICIDLIPDILKNILVFGFCSWKVNRENGSIFVIDYSDGDLYYRVDNSTCIYQFFFNFFNF
jgi:hypothetical protein